MVLISVILPTYNRAHVLQRSIQSVLVQSYTNFELIVIDDGSTDNTRAIVDSFQDIRIHYLYQQNKERSAARNAGIEVSRGKYLSFIDSDDEYLPNKLDIQVKAIERKGAGMVMSGLQESDSHGCIMHTSSPWVGHPSSSYKLEEWLLSPPVSFCTALIEKQWIEAVGGFDQDLNSSEDVDLWFRMVRAGCQMEWVEEIVLRVYPNLIEPKKYLENYLHLLEKVFSNKNGAEKLELNRKEAEALLYLNVAVQLYLQAEAEEGQRYLLKAIQLKPELNTRSNHSILEMLVSHCWRTATPEPVRYMKFVMNHLPEELNWLLPYRRWALGHAWMAAAFRARRCKLGKGGVRAVLNTIRYAPRLAFNYGLLATGGHCALSGKW